MKLKSPKFYVPKAKEDYGTQSNTRFDIMLIKLQSPVDGIEPIWLPWSIDFYFVDGEDKTIIFATLRNGDKQKSLEHRHEKCTRVQVHTGTWCFRYSVDFNNETLTSDQQKVLQYLSIHQAEEPLNFRTLCTRDYHGFKVSYN